MQVYCPYLLISKKRYAGLLYTNPDKHDKMDSKVVFGSMHVQHQCSFSCIRTAALRVALNLYPAAFRAALLDTDCL